MGIFDYFFKGPQLTKNEARKIVWQIVNYFHEDRNSVSLEKFVIGADETLKIFLETDFPDNSIEPEQSKQIIQLVILSFEHDKELLDAIEDERQKEIRKKEDMERRGLFENKSDYLYLDTPPVNPLTPLEEKGLKSKKDFLRKFFINKEEYLSEFEGQIGYDLKGRSLPLKRFLPSNEKISTHPENKKKQTDWRDIDKAKVENNLDLIITGERKIKDLKNEIERVENKYEKVIKERKTIKGKERQRQKQRIEKEILERYIREIEQYIAEANSELKDLVKNQDLTQEDEIKYFKILDEVRDKLI